MDTSHCHFSHDFFFCLVSYLNFLLCSVTFPPPPTSFFPLTPFLKTSLIPTIFKAFMECVKRYRSRFMFWFFGHEACRILAPHTELEPTPQHWKAESQPLDHRGSPELIVY